MRHRNMETTKKRDHASIAAPPSSTPPAKRPKIAVQSAQRSERLADTITNAIDSALGTALPNYALHAELYAPRQTLTSSLNPVDVALLNEETSSGTHAHVLNVGPVVATAPSTPQPMMSVEEIRAMLERKAASLATPIAETPRKIGFFSLPQELRDLIYEYVRIDYQVHLPERVRDVDEPEPAHYNYLKSRKRIISVANKRSAPKRYSNEATHRTGGEASCLRSTPYQNQYLMVKRPFIAVSKQANLELYAHVEHQAALHGGEIGATCRNFDFGSINRFLAHLGSKSLEKNSSPQTIVIHLIMSDPAKAANSTDSTEHLDLVKSKEGRFKEAEQETVRATRVSTPTAHSEVQPTSDQAPDPQISTDLTKPSVQGSRIDQAKVLKTNTSKVKTSKKTKAVKSEDVAPAATPAEQHVAEATRKDFEDQVQSSELFTGVTPDPKQNRVQLFNVKYFAGDIDFYEADNVCDALNTVRNTLPQARRAEFLPIFDAFELSAAGNEFY